MNAVTLRSRLRALLPAVAAVTMLVVPTVSAAGQTGSYVIGAQDVLQINVFGQDAIGGNYTVETDGTFTFPMIGRVKAAGFTLRDFEAELTRQLADGFFRNPQVSVAVEQYRSQRIFVVGEVRQSGTYPLTGDMTLIEALSGAGSTLPTASGEVLVVRAKDPESATGPTLPNAEGAEGNEVFSVDVRTLQSGALSQNVTLRDGDTIFVPRAEDIFVFGEVRNPGSYPIRQGRTVLQALSLAGGATQFAALNRIKIIRIVDGQREELDAELTDIVETGDTIIVAQRFF